MKHITLRTAVRGAVPDYLIRWRKYRYAGRCLGPIRGVRETLLQRKLRLSMLGAHVLPPTSNDSKLMSCTFTFTGVTLTDTQDPVFGLPLYSKLATSIRQYVKGKRNARSV